VPDIAFSIERPSKQKAHFIAAACALFGLLFAPKTETPSFS
jgi:hypothetical protein